MVTKVSANSHSRLGASGVSFPKFAMVSLTSIHLPCCTFQMEHLFLPLPGKFLQPFKPSFGEAFPKLHATIKCFSVVLESRKKLGCTKGLKEGRNSNIHGK